MKIEVGKLYATRDGRQVRIYSTDGCGEYPIHGAVKIEEGWESADWTHKGRFNVQRPDMKTDIVAEWVEEEERTYWINFYPRNVTDDRLHKEKGMADRCASVERIACVPVTIKFKKGDGL